MEEADGHLLASPFASRQNTAKPLPCLSAHPARPSRSWRGQAVLTPENNLLSSEMPLRDWEEPMKHVAPLSGHPAGVTTLSLGASASPAHQPR